MLLTVAVGLLLLLLPLLLVLLSNSPGLHMFIKGVSNDKHWVNAY